MMLSIDRMISKLEGIEKKVKLISQFDLVEKPFGASQTLDQDSDLRQRISNKRIRKKYVGEIKKFLQEYT